MDNFYVSLLILKSIFSFISYNLKKKNKNRNDSIVNQKVNIYIFKKYSLWISLLDKL